MDTWFVIMKPDTHTKKQTASSANAAGQIGCLHVEGCKQNHTHYPTETLTPNESDTPS